nr:glycosyltransferase [Thalassotalea sp. G2M2-11]
MLIITNLFPLPWEPNRATFNRQQFEPLVEEYDVHYLIPIAFIEWFKYRKTIRQSAKRRYVPYFFTPKVGRRFYSLSMFLSMLLHSGLWLKQLKPTKLLASWAYPDAVAARWLSQCLGADFYFKVHGSDIDIQCQHSARAKQVVKASRFAKGILSVSQALAKKMITMGVDEKKIKVIYNGVDHNKFNQVSERPHPHEYLLFIGNLKHDKGVIELLEGFAKISSYQSELNLIFAGNGIMKPKLIELAKQYHITNQVIFLGSVDHSEIPMWLNHCRALILPSYHEGVPNVILEAMACGKPIIATDVGGIPEIVDEQICGKIIPAQDDNAIASAIRYISEHHWDPSEIKKHSLQFSWQKNKAQLVNLLESK